jgi:hypothetical protein
MNKLQMWVIAKPIGEPKSKQDLDGAYQLSTDMINFGVASTEQFKPGDVVVINDKASEGYCVGEVVVILELVPYCRPEGWGLDVEPPAGCENPFGDGKRCRYFDSCLKTHWRESDSPFENSGK